MNTLTQSALESYLWGAATLLRGLVDAGDCKQFVCPLLFYKRLSDAWDEDFAGALAALDEDEGYARETEVSAAAAGEAIGPACPPIWAVPTPATEVTG